MKVVDQINKKITTILILVCLIAVGNIVYGVLQFSTLINPYKKLLFPNIKNIDEIQAFYIDNEKQIHDVIKLLNELPYEKISIYDWIILQENIISADGKDIFLDESFDDKRILLEFFEKEVKYIEKNNDVIYIVTDTAIDYSQGIVWMEKEKTELSSMELVDDIYYTKHLLGNFWIFKGRD